MLAVTCSTSKGEIRRQPYSISTFNNPYYYEPVFTLNSPIHIPTGLWEGVPKDNEFPIKINLEVEWHGDKLQFDIMMVYDAALE
jgi:hypothetical protein